MKRFISIFLSVCLLLTSLGIGVSAYAEELQYFQRGVLTDGTNTAYWIIDKDNKILYLSGDGITNAGTPDYPSAEEGPFAGRKDVTRIVIEEDVARVGNYVFANMTAVDTIEIQSNLLKNENSISTNAFSGDTSIRNVQGDSEVLSTNTLINAVKVGIGVVSGDWLSVVKNVIHTGSDVVSDDGTLDDVSVDAMVNDYITNGETVFIGDLETVKAEYQERIENPCYSSNAFHHQLDSEITVQPTCTEDGVRTYTCEICETVETQTIPALGHIYTESVFSAPTCTKRGILENYCSVCGESTFRAIAPLGHTEALIARVEPTCTSVGYTAGSYCTVCGETVNEPVEIPLAAHNYDYHYSAEKDSYTAVCASCNKTVTDFENDTEALLDAEAWAASLSAEDYTAESFSALENTAALHSDLKEGEKLNYPQFIIDRETAAILTSITQLQPYLNLNLTGDNGSVSAAMNGNTLEKGTHSIVFGDEITFSAVADSGYKFVAWYDVNTLRYLSSEPVFTYIVTSNLDLQAVFVRADCSSLIFKGEADQIKAVYSHTSDEWTELGGIDVLLPPVPYKYGYTNGRWVYDDRSYSDLELNKDVVIRAEYDEVEVFVPELPALKDLVTPALSLTYVFSEENNESVGSLIMAANIPAQRNIVDIGIAYYKQTSRDFNPTEMKLTLNNKLTTARFDGISESGLYILNIRKLSAKSSWAIRGYITYYDRDDNLRVAYTNQINIVNKQAVL